MTIVLEVPGEASVEIEHLLFDVNGTLTDRGRLLDGIGERLERLRPSCTVHLLSADTFDTLDELARSLDVDSWRVSQGPEKREIVRQLGAQRCAAIGNGRNDVEMLIEARLGIAILGPEGLSSAALSAADVVCPSIAIALDLLLDPKALTATLRP
jgi:soluble P-type ATPase